MFLKSRYFLLLVLIVILFVPILSACSARNGTSDQKMMPLDKMPAEVQSAPVAVQQAYQFASANPDVMKGIPCY